jgi:hypothetical protein
MTTPRGKNSDYWQGYNEAAARRAAKDARAAVDAMPNFADLANEVARQLGRDNVRKQRIFARSPHIFGGMDASELGQASSRELALRELKELGINIGEDDDPEKMLDMHHAGRAFARDRTPGSGGPILGGKPSAIFNPSASDGHEGGSFVDKYLEDR